MPSATFTHRSVAPVPTTEAFQALQRLETWREIGGVTSVTNGIFDDQGLAGYDFIVAAAGSHYRGHAHRLEVDHQRRIAMAIESEQMLGRIIVELVPVDDQTQVDLVMEMTARGFLAGVLFGVISRSVAANFAEIAERFAASLAMPPAPTDG